MGSVRGGPRRPNTTAYFVALAGILVLLAILCCYFVYYCVNKVKELTREDSPLQTTTSSAPPRATYPVQPIVRDSATAMAKLCRQLPAKGDTVFPAATSPATTDTTDVTATRATDTDTDIDTAATDTSSATATVTTADDVPPPLQCADKTAACGASDRDGSAVTAAAS